MLPLTAATALAALICPACGEDLTLDEARLACPTGHRYDAAKQGYFNLLTGRGTNFREDTAAMVQARVDFLTSGHYAPLVECITTVLQEHTAAPDLVLDAGAGTGYYLDAVLEQFPAAEAIAVDISRYAVRRAAKVQRTVALAWDVWQPLPVAGASVDVVLNVFAPRNPGEFVRVLSPGGLLLIVTPLPGHLQELARLAGMLSIAEHKQEKIAADFSDDFVLLKQQDLSFELSLDRTAMADAVLMGPAGHHLTAAEVRVRVAEIEDPLAVTAALSVQLFQRRIVLPQ